MTTNKFDILTTAENLLDLRRPGEALQAVATLLAEEPDDAVALCLAARAHLELGDPNQARGLASRAVASQPGSQYPLQLLALALSRLGRTDEAINAAQASVTCAPDFWGAHYTLAWVSSGVKGKSAIAWAAARRAVELAPSEPDAHAVLGCVAVDEEDKETAARALHEALRLDPNHTSARNDLGRLHLLRNDHAGAAAHFTAVVASDPRSTLGRQNITITLAAAVGRTVTWVSVAVFLVGRFAVKDDGNAVAWGYVFLIALVLVVAFHSAVAARAVRGGSGPYLRSVPRRDPLMTAAIGVLILAIVTLGAASVIPPASRTIPGLAGVALLWISWGLLYLRIRR